MSSRWRWVLVAVLLGALSTGCGPSREKGKNQDFDRPKPSEKK
ncbi:MAG TPA: hypothetical protein VKE74_36220 [Gemmataceae bacterium]|nr:hypothetical protein [Gemmataceae bacterium]